jgi:CSLREA domain-containing protein
MRRLGFLAAVAVALTLPAPAAATDFSVTTQADLDGAVCGSPCSLRQAIKAANTTVSVDGSADVIHLPAGRLERNPAFPSVVVTASVVIVGMGARRTTIAGSPNPGFGSRAISVAASSPIDVELRDLSVADGLAEGSASTPAQGGGIYATGARLTLRRITVRDNQALDARGPAVAGTAEGGGIFSTNGSLTLEHVTIRDNRVAAAWAGGINAITAAGGGASIRGGATLIRNSTVAGNAADAGPGWGHGGGLELLAGARLDGVTVTGNRVDGSRGTDGANVTSGIVSPTVSGSIIADGRGAATSNCARALTSRGGNIEDAGQCGFAGASDRAMTDPRLGPLDDNGGPTDTRALLAGSPAVDLDPVCAVAVDQRGTTRPQGAACDAGAFELVPTSTAGAPAPSVPQRCALGLKGDTRLLRARIVCALAATTRLSGRATIRPRRARGTTRRVALRRRTISVAAARPATVRLAVPRAAIRGVRRKAKVTITLTARQIGGRQTARIARLRAARRRPPASSSAARARTRRRSPATALQSASERRYVDASMRVRIA